MRRIASTDRNMERVRDIMATIEEQLEPLAEKAETTKKYMALSVVNANMMVLSAFTITRRLIDY